MARPDEGKPRRPPPTIRSQAVRRFVAWSLGALGVCSVGGVLAVQAAAADIALEDASTRGGLFAHNVVAPLINSRVRAGDPEPVAVLERVMRDRMRDGSMVRIKIWAQDGSVIWSDVPAIAGERFTLEPEDAALFGTTKVTASVSDLKSEENELERSFGELLEVYAGDTDADGRPVVIESYWNTSRIGRDVVVISARIVPLLIGVLVVFMLAIVPLALSLARRVDRAQADRAAMLRHALAASDLERRRISRELHDGLIQDLTSLGYALPGVAAQLPPEASAARAILESVRSGLQVDISSLRNLLADLYPANLTRDGLAAAVEQLAAPIRDQGLRVDIAVDETLGHAPAEAVQLSYRVVREGLRNIIKHAGASEVTVVACIDGDDVLITVADNGAGIKDVESSDRHLGIRLMQDDVADIGGVVSLQERRSGGAQLTARFPMIFTWSWAG